MASISVYMIDVQDGGLVLRPCASWEIVGGVRP